MKTGFTDSLSMLWRYLRPQLATGGVAGGAAAGPHWATAFCAAVGAAIFGFGVGWGGGGGVDANGRYLSRHHYQHEKILLILLIELCELEHG